MIFKQKNIAKDPENDIMVQTKNSQKRLEILHEGLNETLYSAIYRKDMNDLQNIVTFMNTLNIEPKEYVIRYACLKYSREIIEYLIKNYGNKFIDETGLEYTTGKYYNEKNNFINRAHYYIFQARKVGLHKMANWFEKQIPINDTNLQNDSISKKRKISV